MKASRNWKSAFLAATLSLALAFGMTAGQAILTPDTAQAGVIGGLKKAASMAGGAVKKAAVSVGSAGKKIGVGIGKNAKEGIGVLGRTPGISTVKGGVKKAAKAAVKVVRR